ncbi:hypothetical protein ACFWVC_21575 [Streptomyces sp. NPDC058691]|uniref:hypothetical protein n=1 Tax=Streptomyces sp. NPDC058691 TaxID=3346601 RepID=UPI003652E33D
MPFPLEMVRQIPVHDASEEPQNPVSDLLVPRPGHCILDPHDLPSLTGPDIPAVYIISDDDRGIPRPGEVVARRLNVEPVMIPGATMPCLPGPATSSGVSRPAVAPDALKLCHGPGADGSRCRVGRHALGGDRCQASRWLGPRRLLERRAL